MSDIDRIETSALMSDFGAMAKLAYEWERDGLGTWIVFEHPNHERPLFIATPKHDLDQAGCSVFFRDSTNIEGAVEIAQEVTQAYNLNDPRWMTSDGVSLKIK